MTVLSDESLLNRIKLVLNDKSINYYFAKDGEHASVTAQNEEIAVLLVDYNLNVVSGEEMCELMLSYNPDMQIMMLFEEKDTKEVLNAYNSLHINKLICKEYLVLEDLPSLVESCLHTYNREEEIEKMNTELDRMNEMYLRPMNEMASILNERLSGYESVIKTFKNSVRFVLNSSEEALKSVDSFVDRILNDYIQIYMIQEPDVSLYFNRIHESFNDPEGRRYFKFVCDEIGNIPDELKYSLLFILDVLTISFDCFYKYYRGKIAITEPESGKFEINAIYEVRKSPQLLEIDDYIIKLIDNILNTFAKDIRYGQKNNIIQYKAVIA